LTGSQVRFEPVYVSLSMRVIPWAAIAAPFLTYLFIPGLPSAGQAVTPVSKDVVVEIQVTSPGQSWLPTRPAPSLLPAAQAQFPSLNSEQLDRQLQRYLAYLEQNGVPDILIVGSSRALQGVDPLVLQEGLRQQGYGGLKVFNFGVNGATAQVVDWLLSHLLLADQTPRLILWADGSRAFNSGRVDHTFNNIMRSQGHQQLMAGNRLITHTAGLKLGQVCMDLLSLQLPAPQASNPGFSLNPSPQPRQARQSTSSYCQRPIKFMVQPGPSLPLQSSPRLLELLGFQTVTTQFDPDRYFQRYTRVSGRFDGDYRNFNLQGIQARALEHVVHLTRARQIPLVLVNLPLTAIHLDPTRRFYEDQFRTQMQRVPNLMQNHYFADPSHLNRFGATAIATQLGKDLQRLNLPLFQERYSNLHPGQSPTTPLGRSPTLTIRILRSVK
jgi:hypothetical protein